VKVISYVFRGRCGHELSAFVFVNSVAFNYSLLIHVSCCCSVCGVSNKFEFL
jgi:hypothetical protein